MILDMGSSICDLESIMEGRVNSTLTENKYEEPNIIPNKVKEIKILAYFVFLQIFFFYSFYIDFFVPKSSIILSGAILVLAGRVRSF